MRRVGGGRVMIAAAPAVLGAGMLLSGCPSTETLVAGLPDAGAVAAEDALAPEGAVTCSAALDSDPANCGRCAHDCLGGGCAAGRCQPVTLRSGVDSQSPLIIDGGLLYWLDSRGAIKRCSVTKCEPSTVAISPNGASIINAFAVSDRVYFLEWRISVDGGLGSFQDEIWATEKSGGTATALALSPGFSGFVMAANSTRILWSGTTAGGLDALYTCDSASCVPAERVTGSLAPNSSLSADDVGALWVTSDSHLEELYFANDRQTTVASSAYRTSPALRRERAAWVAERTNGGADQAVVFGVFPGLSETPLAAKLAAVGGLALDDDSAYFTTAGEGTVMRAPLDGGAVETLVASQASPGAIVVDNTAIYWFSGSAGAIMKLAK